MRREATARVPDRLRLLIGLTSLVLPTSLVVGGCDDGRSPVDERGNIVMRSANGAECIDLPVGQDAMISNPPKAQNYGNHPLLRVGGKDESLLAFDLGVLPEGAILDSATLQLYVNGGAGNTVKIHAATAAWSEDTVTYQSFNQQFDGEIVGSIDPASPKTLKSADVTSLVTSWLTGARPNHGFLLEAEGHLKTIFVSSDGHGDYAPTLRVCYAAPVVDHCAQAPCQNDGVCMNMDEGYACECAPGFTGTDCELEIDDCAANPCINGDCTDGADGYACSCLPGYEGVDCETNTNDCAANPCENGGICTDGIDGYSCQCDAGYTGSDCEIEIDDCAASPCQNGGVCSDGVDGYSCACPAGFAGASCELDIDECLGAPCENDSACVDGVSAYSCSCLPGFAGAHCEQDIDDCAGSPCLNGGTCIDATNDYACECAAGYAGDNCEVDIDDCAANPCANGSCTDEVNGYACDCWPGFTGADCETPVVVPACVDADVGDVVPATVEGDLAEATDEYSPSCGAGGGADMTYMFTAEVSGAYVFDTIGSELDTVLAVLDACEGNELACNDDTDWELTSLIVMELEAGQSVFIVADSYSGEAGACTLNIALEGDDCGDDPCENGGTCIDGWGTYACECPPAYEGPNCEYMVDQ
jgi:hypothetical protein